MSPNSLLAGSLSIQFRAGLALAVLLLLAPLAAEARNCESSCGTFTFRPPQITRYSGTGPHWRVRCVYNRPANGLHNLRTFLYENGVAAVDPVLATIGDQNLEVGADLKQEVLDGVAEKWWNTDLFAQDGAFYKISVKNQPSDVVYDIHTRFQDISGCGTFGHYLWYVIFDYVQGTVGTETPTRTPTPSITPGGPTVTPSATPSNAVYSFNFESSFDFQSPADANLIYRMPNALPLHPFASWPIDDGSYDILNITETNSGLNGKGTRIQLRNIPSGPRGGGIELFFTGPHALTPGQQYTVSVWTKSDQAVTGAGGDYSDVILAWEPGSTAVDNVADYDDIRERLFDQGGGWKQLALTFTSSASGDRILLGFAGRSATNGNYGCTFDDIYIVSGSGQVNTPTPTRTPTLPGPTATPTRTNTPGGATNTPTPTLPPVSNLVEDYEDGFSAGVNNGWTSWNDSFGAPDQYAQATGRTGSGNAQSVRVYFGSGGTFRPDIPVVLGKQYYIKAWIRSLNGAGTGGAPGDNSVIWAEFGYDLQNRTFAQLGSNPQITFWDVEPKQNANLSAGAWKEYTTPVFTATGSAISLWVKAGSTSPTGHTLQIDDWSLYATDDPTPTSLPATATPTNTVPSGPSATPTNTRTPAPGVAWNFVENGQTNPVTNGNWPQTTDDEAGGLDKLTPNLTGNSPTGDNRYMNLNITTPEKLKIRREPSGILNGSGITCRLVMRIISDGNTGNWGVEVRDSFGAIVVGYQRNAGTPNGAIRLHNPGSSPAPVDLPVAGIDQWHVYWMVLSPNGNTYIWLDPDGADSSFASADLVHPMGTAVGNRINFGEESSQKLINQDIDDIRFALGVHFPSEENQVDIPTPTTTPFVSPTPTNTPTNTPVGKPAWKLVYARQYGEGMTENVAGQSELFATNADGSPANVAFTNQANANTGIFGQTTTGGIGDQPANLRVAFDTNNPVYDFRVFNPPVVSDNSPNCYWLDGLPHHGHYRFEFWWQKVNDDALYEFFPMAPVYHYDNVIGFNTGAPNPVQAGNYSSDARGPLDDNWVNYHGQTFVVPANVNRILGAKAFCVRQGGEKFVMNFSIREGGVNGPQVGPTRSPGEIQSNQFPDIYVGWGLEDVPVTPGQTYCLRVDIAGGANIYLTAGNHFASGNYYRESVSVPGQDIIGIVVGGRSLGAPTPATPTPTATLPTPTNTPVVSTPTPGTGPDNLDYLGLFDFARYWNETQSVPPVYDIIQDSTIDDEDLLRLLDSWHNETQFGATPTPTVPAPTATPTQPAPTATPTQPAGSVFSFAFEDFFTFPTLNFPMPNALPLNLFASYPISDGASFDVASFEESTNGRTGKAHRILFTSPVTKRGAGVEIFFVGDTALVPNKQHTATIWARSEQSSEIVLAWMPGNGAVNGVDSYTAVRNSIPASNNDWQSLSITFTSNATGDRLLYAFYGDFNGGCLFDDLAITQDVP